MKIMHIFKKFKVKTTILLCCLTVHGLVHSGAPAQAYIDMRNGMCKSGGMSGALPYVTDRLTPFVMQMIQMESLIKETREAQDTLAKQCYFGIQILNEIPVNNQRYIIRYKDDDGAIKEAPVSLENGKWKVDRP